MTHKKIWRMVAAALLLCLSLVSLPAKPAQAAVGTISIYPSSGPVGTMVSVTASGFSTNTVYTVTFAGVSVTTGSTVTGNFTAFFYVPSYPRGSQPIAVTTANDTSNIVYYTITPTITLSTLSGHVGNQILVSGTGFIASSTVTIYFDATAVATVGTTTSGTFTNVALTVPGSYGGAHLLKGTDATGDSPSVSFTISPKTVATPPSGAVGGQVTVGGTGFNAGLSVTIYFDSEVVRTTQTNSVGTFADVTFTVPESYQGSHTVKAIDAGSSEATASITIEPAITISPTLGAVKSKVAISGTGFRPDTVITVSFDTANIVTTPTAVTSNSKGGFSASFTIPAAGSGTHQIKASDGINTGTKAFSISPSLSINLTSGFVGAKITASGTGFQASQSISITFDNELVLTASSDASGSFSASFNVPVRAAGTYKIKISDGTNTKEADFSVATNATISPVTSSASPGHLGTTITVSGVGFGAGKTVTISYEGEQVATTTVDNDGSFSANFNAPPSRGGAHTVTASDGVNSIPLTFVMESTAPPVPLPLKPETGTKAKAETLFDWTDVTDPSGVTYTLQIANSKEFSKESIVLEKAELTLSEYTLTKDEKLQSTSKEKPYYWHVKAIDSAANESVWSSAMLFYVGFTLSQQALINIIIGIAAVVLGLLGYWIGRRISFSRR